MYATLAMAAAVRRAVITEGSLERWGTTPPYQGAHAATLVRKDEVVPGLDETLSPPRCDGLTTARAAELAQNRGDVRSYGINRSPLIVGDSLVPEPL